MRRPAMAKHLQIVIVEDVAAEAELTARQLHAAGLEFDLQRVETEDALRNALDANNIDLILADYSLPQFDGLRALEVAVERSPDTPFIFVTGTMGEERAIEALRAGATDYVLKDNLVRLVSVVTRALKEADIHSAKQNAEHTLRDIIAASHDWIWQLDAQCRITFCNQAVTRILGYQPEQVLGRAFQEFVHEDDRELAQSLLRRLGSSRPITGATVRWRNARGKYRWLERNASLLLDAQGCCVGYRGSDRDVTERHVQQARLRRLTRIHRMLSSTSSAIVRSRSREHLVREACRIAVDQGGYDDALIYLQRPDSNVLDAMASASNALPSAAAVTVGTARRAATALSAQAILAAAPIELAQTDDGVFPAEQFLTHEAGSIIVLPLRVDGTEVGIFALNAREEGIFDAAELTVLRELSANVGFALQYFQKDQEIEFLSYFDAATGLAKRSLFCERLTRALSKPGSDARATAVVVFDLQRLSVVNDSYGRYVGDQLLAQIADRMKRQPSESEHLAHFGGGTFAMASGSEVDPADTGHVAQSSAARFFAEPFYVDGHELRPSIRTGIAYYPFDGGNVDAVVQNAEAALKQAQVSGEKYVLYAQISTSGTCTRSAIEVRLQNALARCEFVLFYQPKIDICTGQVQGVEALLRWQDPESGLVSPATFIPLLESNGMIMEVGEWVFEQAARDCQAWVNLGLPPMRVAVNVSPLQLRGREFVDRVLKATRHCTQLAGIDLEITESTLMHDLSVSTRKLERLREAGLRIAIDDFGTGYSSLRHLARLPVDTLKIDRSFIQGITDDADDRTIVATIISLAKSFEMTTVAEGVETEGQLQALRAMKCDLAQGYLFCRPMPMKELSEWLRRPK